MKLTKPTTGEKVTIKEFLRQWREGMRNVTPLQQTTATQFGQFVTLVGVIWGIIFSIRLAYWWMMVILIGGMIVLGVQMLGNWQRKVLLKQMDEIMEEADNIQLNKKEVDDD